MEQTLVIFKPDAVQRGIIGEIITRFERVGLKISGIKMVSPDDAHFHAHYETIGTMITRHGEDIFNVTVEAMKEAPVIAVVLEGINSVDLVRKMVGSTEPSKSAPGTIRGDYAHSNFAYANSEGRTLPNVVHASATPEEAEKEITLWFDESELYNYETPVQRVVRGRKPTK
jgi:nucleoside-diphosphate kinase